MALINSKKPAEQAYEAVSKAYAPQFPDNPLEKAQAIVLLKEALDAGVSVSQLEMKAGAARVSQGDFRSKLAGFIATRFWEHRNNARVIRAISYEPPKPRSGLENVDLTP